MKKSNNNFSEKSFEEMLSKRVVPMLLEYKPFNDMLKYVSTKQMQTIINELKEIVKDEKKQILDVNNLHKEKSKIAPRVLYLSSQLNSGNKEAERELEKEKNRMLEINNEISNKESSIQELLVNKEEKNLELLKETLEISYDIIKKDKSLLDPLLKEIEQMRKDLENKRILRDELQERINLTYSFIHGFMGGKDTEKFDNHMLD